MMQFRHLDYSFEIPDDWRDVSNVILMGPPYGDYSPNIAVSRIPVSSGTSADDYANSQLSLLREALGSQSFKVLEEGKTRCAGSEAFRRVYSFVAEPIGVPVQQMQVYFTNGDIAYTITATNDSRNFHMTTALIQHVLDSFAISKS